MRLSLDNFKVLVIINALTGIYAGMIFVIWQPFILALGASMTVVGLLESISHRHKGLLTNLAQFAGGKLTYFYGKKFLLLLSGFLYLSALLLYVAANILWSFYILFPAAIIRSLSALADPVYDALIAECVKPKERGIAYSIATFSMLAPSIFTAPIGGIVADTYGFLPIFLTGMVIEIANIFLIAFFLKETRDTKLVLRAKFKLAKRPTRKLLKFYTATAIDAFAWGLGATLLFGLLTKNFGFSKTLLGFLHSAFLIAWCSSQLPIGKLIDKHGAKKFLLLSEGLGVILIAGWLFSQNFESFLLLQLIFGLIAATWVPAMLTYMAKTTSDEERASKMGELFAFRGLMAFSAPFIGGILYDLWGYSAPLLSNLIGVVVAFLLIALLVEE